jgi:hypothetical protein
LLRKAKKLAAGVQSKVDIAYRTGGQVVRNQLLGSVDTKVSNQVKKREKNLSRREEQLDKQAAKTKKDTAKVMKLKRKVEKRDADLFHYDAMVNVAGAVNQELRSTRGVARAAITGKMKAEDKVIGLVAARKVAVDMCETLKQKATNSSGDVSAALVPTCVSCLTLPPYSFQYKNLLWTQKDQEDTIKQQSTEIKQLREMNDFMRKGLRTELEDALQSFGGRQAKQRAAVKIATMDEDSRGNESEEQDQVYKWIGEHFARNGKGNFQLHVRELAMKLMTRDVSAETAAAMLVLIVLLSTAQHTHSTVHFCCYPFTSAALYAQPLDYPFTSAVLPALYCHIRYKLFVKSLPELEWMEDKDHPGPSYFRDKLKEARAVCLICNAIDLALAQEWHSVKGDGTCKL